MDRIDSGKFTDRGPTVDVTPTLVDVSITKDDELGFVVRPLWSSVDRPEGAGIIARTEKLAQRLAAAIRAGAAVRAEGIARDVHGKTFAHQSFNVRSRTLNSDLTRLGF